MYLLKGVRCMFHRERSQRQSRGKTAMRRTPFPAPYAPRLTGLCLSGRDASLPAGRDHAEWVCKIPNNVAAMVLPCCLSVGLKKACGGRQPTDLCVDRRLARGLTPGWEIDMVRNVPSPGGILFRAFEVFSTRQSCLRGIAA